jgi:hypothetical protein
MEERHAIASFHGHDASTEEEEINLLLLRFDLVACFVDVSQERYIALDEVNLALWLEFMTLCLDEVGLLLASAYEVYSGAVGVSNELSRCTFSYAAGSADCDEGFFFSKGVIGI